MPEKGCNLRMSRQSSSSSCGGAMCRFFSLWLWLFLLVTVLVQAQGTPPPQAASVPTFTSRTELVTVPVVVTKRVNAREQLGLKGWLDEHVAGLKKGDFTVEEDGQVKSIASFEEVSRSSAATKDKPIVPGLVTNQVV